MTYIALTGDQRYLDAMLGGWDLYHSKWEHVGGSMSMEEFREGSAALVLGWIETTANYVAVFSGRFSINVFTFSILNQEKYVAEN